MVDPTTALAAVLGVALGVFMLAFPGAVVRAQMAGRLPADRGGEYGTDREVPERWLWLVRALGGGCLLLGSYFTATVLGL